MSNTWIVAGPGAWINSGNWSNGVVPNAVDAIATFLAQPSQNNYVALGGRPIGFAPPLR